MLGDTDGTWFVLRHTADAGWESVRQHGEFLHADDTRDGALDIALRCGIPDHLAVVELFAGRKPITLIDADEAERRDTGEPVRPPREFSIEISPGPPEWMIELIAPQLNFVGDACELACVAVLGRFSYEAEATSEATTLRERLTLWIDEGEGKCEDDNGPLVIYLVSSDSADWVQKMKRAGYTPRDQFAAHRLFPSG